MLVHIIKAFICTTMACWMAVGYELLDIIICTTRWIIWIICISHDILICISHNIIMCMTRWIFDMNYSMDIKYEFLDDMMTVGCHDM